MQKLRILVRAVGAIMLAIGLSAAGVFFAPWSNSHADIVMKIMVGSLLAAIILATIWMLTSDGDKGKESSSTPQLNRADRDNRGLQAIVGGDQHIYGDSALKQLLDNPIPAPLPLPAEQKPEARLEIGKPRWAELVYDMHPGLWREADQFDYDKNPRISLLIPFTLPIPSKGKRPHEAISIVAILKLSHSSGGIKQVPRAYWLKETHNQVIFDSGIVRELLIGRHEDKLFAVYNNQYQYPGGHNSFDVPLRELGERTTLPATDTISVEISLIDAMTRTTVEQKQYLIGFQPLSVKEEK